MIDLLYSCFFFSNFPSRFRKCILHFRLQLEVELQGKIANQFQVFIFVFKSTMKSFDVGDRWIIALINNKFTQNMFFWQQQRRHLYSTCCPDFYWKYLCHWVNSIYLYADSPRHSLIMFSHQNMRTTQRENPWGELSRLFWSQKIDHENVFRFTIDIDLRSLNKLSPHHWQQTRKIAPISMSFT